MVAQLEVLYDEINHRGRTALAAGREELDPYLAGRMVDSRAGLTLLGHLPAHVCRNLEFYLQTIAQLAPDQYYYPAKDMHITVMDLLAAQAGFSLTAAQFDHYQRVVAPLVASTPPIHWRIQGLIVSPSAIMARGFYSPELADLRNRLRQALPAAGLKLAERYPTFSGHVTVVRFKRPLKESAALLAKLAAAKNLDFGAFSMHSLDLVVHDWYNHQITSTAHLPLAD